MKNQLHSRLQGVTIFLLCLTFLFSACGVAGAEAKFSVFPSEIVLLIEAGEREIVTTKIVNLGDERLIVKAVAEDYVRDEEGNLVPLKPEEAEKFGGCGRWVSFHPLACRVELGETFPVEVTVRVPADVEPGTYSTYLIYGASPEGGKSSSVGVKGQIALPLRVNVPGEGFQSEGSGRPVVVKQGRLVSFKAPRFNYRGQISFATTVQNTGNVHLNIEEVIEIQDMSGHLVEKLAPSRFTVLPERSEAVFSEWGEIPLFGRFKAVATLEAGLEGPWVQSAEFWIISWKLIFAILVGLTTLAVLSVTLFRRFSVSRRGRRG